MILSFKTLVNKSRTAKPSLLHCSDPGAITRWRRSHYAYLHKHMSRHTIYYRYCRLQFLPSDGERANQLSAELEMTVNMLIQIDKLVQLLESPVFTCKVLNERIQFSA